MERLKNCSNNTLRFGNWLAKISPGRNRPMELSDINELQKTADYYASTKVVRGRWRTSVIIGVLGIVSGFFYSLIFSPINVVLILIGIFLVIVGIRARIVSRLSNLLYCGIALLAMGAWNIAVPISNVYIYFTSYTGSTMPLTLTWGFVLGFLCLGWAGENLSRYRRYSAVSSFKPSDQMLREVENLVVPVLGANVDLEHDIIEFTKLRGWTAASFKAKLSKNSAVVVSKDRSAISFVHPADFDVVDKGRAGLTKYRKVDVRIRSSKITCRMTPLSLQRYGLWKNMPPPPT
jgi:hypothetical protein